MSEADVTEPVVTARNDSWEERHLPSWQRWLNTFCENWIFAFLIAMGIRHFALEAYRIPTASMEPMLYGDPAFTRADHVVVDKFFSRFSRVNRFDVAVFQFPWPEVGSGAEVSRAWQDVEGQRNDGFPFNPQLHRNFVKRVVATPGEVFFIAHGDIHVRDADGRFMAATKPEAVQEALWQTIYRHGAQSGYRPWASLEGRAQLREDAGGGLALRFDDESRLRFSQPLRNFYVKPGQVRILPRGAAESGRGDQGDLVEVAMDRPVFRIGNQEGNIWDLDRWDVMRLTSADLDSASYGRLLNAVMTELVGDVRVSVRPTEMDNRLDLILRRTADRPQYPEADEHRLSLTTEGWSLFAGDGAQLASGPGPVLGHEWGLALVDQRVVIYRDGRPLPDVAPVGVDGRDPNRSRMQVMMAGQGSVLLTSCRVDRDIHYSTDGFLADERMMWREARRLDAGSLLFELMMVRRQMIECLIDADLRAALLADLDSHDPAAGGHPHDDRLDWLLPIGDSPERALQAPADGYLMLGDNSPLSWDGRNWGWVPASNLRGRVLWVVLPWQRRRWVQ